VDPSFANWYKLASIEPTDDMLRKRWAGIEAAGAIGLSDEIIRLFLGRASTKTETIAAFRKCFFEADSLFVMQGNDNELRVLAGALLAYYLQQPVNPKIVHAAVAILCSACQGLIKETAVADVVTRAGQVILTQALEYRSSTICALAPSENFLEPAIQALAKAADGNENKIVVQATLEGFNRLPPVLNSINALIRAHNSLAEETNILWWLFGQFSTTLSSHYTECAAAVATLPLAQELADLTNSSTGPASADAILGRMLSATKESNTPVTLGAVLEATPGELRKSLLGDGKGSALLDFCPVHFTLDQIDVAGSINGALANTSNTLSLRLSEALIPHKWASQYYRECLLLGSQAN
jgi:hypothetical protein